MGPIGCPEMSVRNYHYLLHNIPEERSSHLHHGGSCVMYFMAVVAHLPLIECMLYWDHISFIG